MPRPSPQSARERRNPFSSPSTRVRTPRPRGCAPSTTSSEKGTAVMNPNETPTTEGSPRPENAAKSKRSLHWRFDDLAHGRCRASVERGVLEHVDQLRLSSELQREQFARACDAKESGCFDEVL